MYANTHRERARLTACRHYRFDLEQQPGVWQCRACRILENYCDNATNVLCYCTIVLQVLRYTFMTINIDGRRGLPTASVAVDSARPVVADSSGGTFSCIHPYI